MYLQYFYVTNIIVCFIIVMGQAEKKTPAFCNLARAVADKGIVAVHVDTSRGWRLRQLENLLIKAKPFSA